MVLAFAEALGSTQTARCSLAANEIRVHRYSRLELEDWKRCCKPRMHTNEHQSGELNQFTVWVKPCLTGYIETSVVSYLVAQHGGQSSAGSSPV
jgi:hypothetical protein